MEIVKRLQLEVEKGFSKSELERIVDLPMNTLSSILTGKKKMTAKQELSVGRFLDEHPNLNPLDYPKRTRKVKTGKDKPKAVVDFSKKTRDIILKYGDKLIKNEMPKGLSLAQQLEWREINLNR